MKKINIIILISITAVILLVIGGIYFITKGKDVIIGGAKPVSNITNASVDDISNKFCSGLVNIDYKKTDYSSGYAKKLGDAKINELMDNLVNNKYSNNQIPEALQYVGLKLMQNGAVDESINIYKCASEKYYDMISMYRLASLYKHGTDSIKNKLPEAVIKNEISIDFERSYFWIASAMYVDLAEKTSLLSSETQLGWSSIALLDDLQNTGKLSDKEMTDAEKEARDFIGKRYPEVLKSN